MAVIIYDANTPTHSQSAAISNLSLSSFVCLSVYILMLVSAIGVMQSSENSSEKIDGEYIGALRTALPTHNPSFGSLLTLSGGETAFALGE
jgi:hypothetical protein